MSLYAHWQLAPARVGRGTLLVATKPGVMGHGAADVPSQMLAEWVDADESPAAGTRSLHLRCGNGLVAAVAARRGFAPIAIDRSVPNVEAATRTLAAVASDDATAAAGRVVHAVLASPMVADASCALVTIRIPLDKVGLQQAIHEAHRCLSEGGRCVLAGANDEGAKSAAKLLAATFGAAQLEAQHSGCRLLVATKGAAVPADPAPLATPWCQAEPMREQRVTVGGYTFALHTRPGVFSWEHLDEATALLGDCMRVEPGESVLDLGCGAGALGIAAARASGTGRVLLVDADADAVRCAEHNVALARCANATVRASDVADAVGAEERFDVVVSNPPFHLGKGTDLTLPQAFIEGAWGALRPGGRLYLVANRTLPYERLIHAIFGEVRVAHDGQRFKVLGAVRLA